MANKFLNILSDNVSFNKNKINIDLNGVGLSGETNYEITFPIGTVLNNQNVAVVSDPYYFTTSPKNFYGLEIDLTKFSTFEEFYNSVKDSIYFLGSYATFPSNPWTVRSDGSKMPKAALYFLLCGLKTITLETRHLKVVNSSNNLTHTHYSIGVYSYRVSSKELMMADVTGWATTFTKSGSWTKTLENGKDVYTFTNVANQIDNRSTTDPTTFSLDVKDFTFTTPVNPVYKYGLEIVQSKTGEYWEQNGGICKILLEYDRQVDEFVSGKDPNVLQFAYMRSERTNPSSLASFFDPVALSNCNINDYEIYINGQLRTDLTVENPIDVNYTHGDIYVIKFKNSSVQYLPRLNSDFSFSDIEFLSPLPTLSVDFEHPCTDFTGMLKYVYGKLPTSFFAHNTSVTNFTNCFANCRLSLLPEDLFKYCLDAEDFTGCFSGSWQLRLIPDNLFKYNTKATSFSRCFYNVQGKDDTKEDRSGVFVYYNPRTAPLKISNDIFKYNTEVTDFSECFAESNIDFTNSSSDLFKYNTKAINFTKTFYHTTIASIPENLFAYVTTGNGLTFNSCFAKCSSLTTIPNLFGNTIRNNSIDFTKMFESCCNLASISSSLFDNCTGVNNFAQAFYCVGQSKYRGALPELWVTHSDSLNLYECFYTYPYATNKNDAIAAGLRIQ